MLIQLSRSSTLNKIPLSKKDCHKIFTILVSELKDEKELTSFVRLLGKPQSVEIYFCEDAEMRSFQKRFRNLNRTTDVLSFPSMESPDNHERGYMGSIIVSLSQVEKNAKRYKRSCRYELVMVVVHGFLHLLGFDHVKVSSTKKKRMFTFQERILKRCQSSGLLK